MFNNVATVSDTTERANSKMSAAKSIGFRPGPEFRAKVDALAQASHWSITDIARVGMQAFWPEIEAIVLSNAQPPQNEDEIVELRQFIALCRSAKSRGIDPRRALTDALEARLGADAASPSAL